MRLAVSWKNSLQPLHAAQQRLKSVSVDDTAAQQPPRDPVDGGAVKSARSQRRPPDAGLPQLLATDAELSRRRAGHPFAQYQFVERGARSAIRPP